MKKYFLGAVLGVLALSATGIGIYYYTASYTCSTPQQIIPFDETRDTGPILDLIAKDRYWLIASADYSAEYMLETRSPNTQEPEYFGKLIIKVLYESQEFVGFVAYYLRNFFTGRVLFLAVKDEFRGKGYGKQLLEYALADLKKKGVSYATLVTRVSNVKAQSLYKKTGFDESNRDGEFVYFAKSL